MDYAKPQEVVKGMLATGQMKLDLPVHQLLIRGAPRRRIFGRGYQYGGGCGG
jgi:hypothetical protein